MPFLLGSSEALEEALPEVLGKLVPRLLVIQHGPELGVLEQLPAIDLPLCIARRGRRPA